MQDWIEGETLGIKFSAVESINDVGVFFARVCIFQNK